MLVVNYKTTARSGEWEGKQQDASQETCLCNQYRALGKKSVEIMTKKLGFAFCLLLLCQIVLAQSDSITSLKEVLVSDKNLKKYSIGVMRTFFSKHNITFVSFFLIRIEFLGIFVLLLNTFLHINLKNEA